MNDWAGINFRDALEDAIAEFFPRVDPNMSQKGARHLAEECLREVAPRAVGGSEHILETVRSGGAGATTGLNRNQIFGRWLHKKVVITEETEKRYPGSGAEYQAAGSLGTDRQEIKVPSDRQQ